LEKLSNLQTLRTSLDHITVNKSIAGRWYQEAAIKAVCDSFGARNRHKALAGHGNRKRQDENRHGPVRCAAAARLGQKHSVSR